jgi:hypothetical protein
MSMAASINIILWSIFKVKKWKIEKMDSAVLLNCAKKTGDALNNLYNQDLTSDKAVYIQE